MVTANINILATLKPPSPRSNAAIATFDSPNPIVLPVTFSLGFSDLAARWEVIDRPGDDPLTLPGGSNAPRAELGVLVQGRDRATSVEPTIDRLRAMARRKLPVIVIFGKSTKWSPSAQWVIEEMSVDPQAWVQGTNDIARAEVRFSLIAALTTSLLKARHQRQARA